MTSRVTVSYGIGDKFTLSDDAVANYGEQYRGRTFVVRHVYDHYAAPGALSADPKGHPGFDASAGSALYGADGLQGDVYEWEMVRA